MVVACHAGAAHSPGVAVNLTSTRHAILRPSALGLAPPALFKIPNFLKTYQLAEFIKVEH